MNCPECQHELREARRGSVAVDFCSACGGTWFDRDELESLRRDPAAPRGAPAPAGSFAATERLDPRTCPRCTIPTLQLGTYRGRPVGRCMNCRGHWIPRYPRKGQLARAQVRDAALRVALSVAGRIAFELT